MAPPPSNTARTAQATVNDDDDTQHRAPRDQPTSLTTVEQQREAKLRTALSRFVEMLDLQPDDFHHAFPGLGSHGAQLLQTDFVQALQKAISMSNDAIIQTAGLPDRLGQLDRLVTQADQRTATHSSGTLTSSLDTYRDDLDLPTALAAASNPAHERRLDALRAELQALQAANKTKHQAMLTAQAQALATQQTLDSTLTYLSQAVEAITSTPDAESAMLSLKQDLSAELGDRLV